MTCTSQPCRREQTAGQSAADFGALTPDLVIAAVEQALGVACSNLCRPLNSYINRVYEVGLADGGCVVAKFYRPGRWSRDALQDELDFLRELHAAEVPVVPPLAGTDGAQLHDCEGLVFAVFPKKGGRPLDEPDAEGWVQLGRLIARMHLVGHQHPPRDRIRLHPLHATRTHLAYILASGTLPDRMQRSYETAVTSVMARIAPLFENVETFRIHGDCHAGNILHRPGEGYHLLDFDDMAIGPAVQDLWLLLPNRLAGARVEMEWLLEGYEAMLAFPRATLRLIEPLRAMRFIHFSAWCAQQKADGIYARLPIDWGTPEFWRQELAALETQRQEIEDALVPGFGA
jgi:Ser/Thr protein kinase RdoA (MazF antagonist)